MISVHQIITLFVLNFAFGGLQNFQNSDFLKTVRLCLEKPTSTKWVYNVKTVTLQSTKKLTQPGFTKGHQILSELETPKYS